VSAYHPKPGEAKALLRGLTSAQRNAVRTGALTRGRGYWPLRDALWAKGLFTTANREDVLTPLGIELQLLIRTGGA